jgi:mono/diheme cytochrome c family protein
MAAVRGVGTQMNLSGVSDRKERGTNMKKWVWISGLMSITGVLVSCAGGESPLHFPPIPAEYADKHMPDGWWTDPAVVEKGKQIFTGQENIDVNCSSCHGKDGKPVKRGARDFRQQQNMKQFSDSFWFWRVSEGVPHTKMKAWKEKLSEEDRWKVIAYEHTFSHGGQPALHDDYTPPASENPGESK